MKPPASPRPGGYVDLQVNGYAGVDFNQDDLPEDEFFRACARLEGDGVTAFLPTIITAPLDRMCGRLARLAALREQDERARRLIPGFHIEGPFLNPAEGYRGAHPLEAIRPAGREEMDRLLEAAGGLTRIVTLAPECDPHLSVTRYLSDLGITVSAGHCDPTLAELDAAIDAGLSMFTHLGNGCPMLLHRHDNILQRVLSRADRLWICFIADGVNIPRPALENYLRMAGDRAVVVSDAMAAAGLGPGRDRLGHWEVEVGEDLAAWAPDRSHLGGASMSLRQMDERLDTLCDLSAQRRHALVCENPAWAIRLTS
ncbi:MAG: N-acetylglucosamine-6-phosphate deacetylase [Kiritimatiellia bacterium]